MNAALDPPIGASLTIAVKVPASLRIAKEKAMSDLRELESQVLAALDLALAEGHIDAAEHLLRALEALCADASAGSPLAEGYLMLVGRVAPRQPLRN